MVEHLTFNQRVAGSSPARVTNLLKKRLWGSFTIFSCFGK
ncbi:hypothetical protein RU91_GL001062 [Lactococcus lactis subsp. lactis]|nr:hypothetical protein RU91_GL001062 [Lactococcus lactis subsp. lactis]